MTHPPAALIAEKAKDARDVFDGTCDTAKQSVDYFEQLILAALETAPVPDLVEAGKVLEGVTPGPWKWSEDFDELRPVWSVGTVQGWGYLDWDNLVSRDANARFIAWCREGVPALIALATAQAAQIAGLEAQLTNTLFEAECEGEDKRDAAYSAAEWQRRAEAAEAKVEELVARIAGLKRERDDWKSGYKNVHKEFAASDIRKGQEIRELKARIAALEGSG